MSRAEDNSRSVSGMTLNDDRLSGERKRPLEPFVSVMGKPIPRNSKTLSEHFRERFMTYSIFHRGFFCDCCALHKNYYK